LKESNKIKNQSRLTTNRKTVRVKIRQDPNKEKKTKRNSQYKMMLKFIEKMGRKLLKIDVKNDP
jgi:hypothetical protein